MNKVSLVKRHADLYDGRFRWAHVAAAQRLMSDLTEIGFSQTEREGMWRELDKGDMHTLRFILCAPAVLARRRAGGI